MVNRGMVKLERALACGIAALTMAAASAAWAKGPERLVVHEWGTFTSIAGDDGVALEWRPLTGPSDLPGFVYTLENQVVGLRNTPVSKSMMEGTVRMETPVIYFYADAPMDVSLKVRFPKGQITEWYPRAEVVDEGGVDWGRFRIIPDQEPAFLTEPAPSHYYPARATDAAPLRVCSTRGDEFEKFLFYRGVGTFDLPLKVTLGGDGALSLRQPRGGQIGRVVIFERRGDRVGFFAADLDGDAARIVRPALDKKLDDVLAALTRQLIDEGLYEKEARAMVDTWRDHWFEEGLRVLTMLPRSATDALLPLTMSPAPTELVRVLVGRVEVVTPELVTLVRARLIQAIHSPEPRRARLLEALQREHGRFLEPVVKRTLASIPEPAERAAIEAAIHALTPLE